MVNVNSVFKNPLQKFPAEINEDYQDNSEYDILTGVFKKIFFVDLLNNHILKEHNFISIVIVDVNGLNTVNKLLGFEAGNALLTKTAKILKEICGDHSIVGRWNGDQFIVSIFDYSEQEIDTICEKIVSNFNKLRNKVHASIEINCATKEGPMITAWDMIREVEGASFQHRTLKGIIDKCSSYHTILKMLQIKNTVYEIHSERLSEYCYQLAVKLGMNKFELYKMQLFSKLHDAGKIFVRDEILNKDGQLTDDEWVEMRMHSENGYLLAKAIPDLNCISYYIRAHHERWDGMGYPLGLKDKQIPIHSRILSVVDAYDAMTNDRPYRKALTIYEALRELKKNAGYQFDPVIVDLFANLILSQDNTIKMKTELEFCN